MNPESESAMEKVNMFIPITKVDAERHEVWGWGAIEEADNSDEILDYVSSKPYFMDWSNRAQKRSGGRSLGNVRAMHQNIAAGKLIELRPDDISKGFYVGAKIVDDQEWKKVESGVYTGFSIGGSYAKRWPDYNLPGKIRYTAKPAELSIVDAPCIPSATFQVVKMDGSSVMRKFSPTEGANMIKVVYADETEDEELEKADFEENKHPRADDGKFTSGGGGGKGGESFNQLRGEHDRNERSNKPKSFEQLKTKHDENEAKGKSFEQLKDEHDSAEKPAKEEGGEDSRRKLINHMVDRLKTEKDPEERKSIERALSIVADDKKWYGESGKPKEETPLRDRMESGPRGVDFLSDKAVENKKKMAEQFRANEAKAKAKEENMTDEEYERGIRLQSAARAEEWERKNPGRSYSEFMGKITEGDVMEKLNNIYELLDGIEQDLLQKQEVPGAPEPIAETPLKSEVGPSYEVENMPAPNLLMEIKPNAEPSQEVLAEHAVMAKDLTAAFEAWLPKVGKLVKSAVDEGIEKALADLSKNTQSAPAQTIKVVRNFIKVRREN